VYLFDTNGIQRLTDSPGDSWHPAFSPDGKRAAFVSNRDGNDDIYVVGPDGTQQITHGEGQNADPTWGP
jgi:TolB protein